MAEQVLVTVNDSQETVDVIVNVSVEIVAVTVNDTIEQVFVNVVDVGDDIQIIVNDSQESVNVYITDINNVDKHYQHVQGSASVSWLVIHGLGKNPTIAVVDTSDTIQVGQITYINLNTVRLDFNNAFAGKAFFN